MRGGRFRLVAELVFAAYAVVRLASKSISSPECPGDSFTTNSSALTARCPRWWRCKSVHDDAGAGCSSNVSFRKLKPLPATSGLRTAFG
jgi:hypothetical protein